MKKLEFIEIEACDEAAELAKGKTWEEIYNTCHRGDWLCWLFMRTNPNDFQLLTLVKGHQANTVRHLMEDERSIAAVDAAIAFGEGKISKKELDDYASADAAAAASAAYAAADSATSAAFAASAADAAADAAFAATSAAAAYASAAATAAASAYATSAAAYYAATSAAEKENQQLTADIARKYLPIEIWNIQTI
jgi:hypothetical protein